MLTAQDYTSFGALMEGRNMNSGNYRYGAGGQEMDNEVKGVGNSISYTHRMYDPRLGRFLSIDPVTAKYPMFTPYQFASNSPIQAIDLEGLQGVRVVNHITRTTTVLLNIVYVPKPLTTPIEPGVKHSNFSVEDAQVLEQQLIDETSKECFEDCQYEDPATGNGYPVLFQFNWIKKNTYAEAQAAVRADPSSTTYLEIYTARFENGGIVAGETKRGQTQISSKNDPHTLAHEIFHNLVHESDNTPDDLYDGFRWDDQKAWHNNGKYGGGIFFYGWPEKPLSQKNVNDALNHMLKKVIEATQSTTPAPATQSSGSSMGPPTEAEMDATIKPK